jgi:hypothetical protein
VSFIVVHPLRNTPLRVLNTPGQVARGSLAQQAERVRRIGGLLNLSEGSGARDGGFVIAGGPEMALAITAKHVLTRYRQSRTAEGTREDHGSCILSMPS